MTTTLKPARSRLDALPGVGLGTGALVLEDPPAPVSAPRDGSIEWCRRWFDRRIKVGAQVELNGRTAHILSARGGFIYLRLWKSGERVACRPYEVSFSTN